MVWLKTRSPKKTVKYIEMDSVPKLIDQSMKWVIHDTLLRVHSQKAILYSWILNITVFVLFVSVFGLTLYVCYKGRPTEYEKYKRRIEDQKFVLNKIRFYTEHMAKKREKESITQLPVL